LFYPVRLLVAVRVPGLGQIAWRIVLTKKLRGHSAKKIHGNREIAADAAMTAVIAPEEAGKFAETKVSWSINAQPLAL